MLSKRKVNSQKVKPMAIHKNKTVDPDKIQGYDLFPENPPYSNIFISAMKFSGKTNLVYHVLKNCTNKNTTVIFISTTVNNDDSCDYMFKQLEKRGVNVLKYESMTAQDGSNVLETFMDTLKEKAKEEKEEQEQRELEKKDKRSKPVIPPVMKYISIPVSAENDDDGDDDNKKKSRKPHKIAPEYFIVLDDSASDLKNKHLNMLITTNRHYKCSVIVSSQYYNHLSKPARGNVDYLILFKNMPLDKLKFIHEDSNMSIDFDTFLDMYIDATSAPYSFLWFDRKRGTFRQNFDQEYPPQTPDYYLSR